MSKRIKVPESVPGDAPGTFHAPGAVSFHFGEVNPVHTFEVKDGYIEVPDDFELDDAHRAIGFDPIEG